jgi:hypothetical protein
LGPWRCLKGLGPVWDWDLQIFGSDHDQAMWHLPWSPSQILSLLRLRCSGQDRMSGRDGPIYYNPPWNVGIVWNCVVSDNMDYGSRSSNVSSWPTLQPRTCKISDRPDEQSGNHGVVSTLATGRISCNLL